jgi:hypothetical protein
MPHRTDRNSYQAIAHQSLKSLATILVSSGAEPSVLPPIFTEICRHLKPSRTRWMPLDLDLIEDLPHILCHWHSDAKYLDAFGSPRPLPMRGPSLSLEELIGQLFPRADVKELLETLLRTGALKNTRQGFVPVRPTVLFRSPATRRLHALSMLMAYMRTTEHNWKHPNNMFFEASVTNPKIPSSRVFTLKKHAGRRGQEYLLEMDALMRRLERRGTGGATTERLGVCAFVYRQPHRVAPETPVPRKRNAKR